MSHRPLDTYAVAPIPTYDNRGCPPKPRPVPVCSPGLISAKEVIEAVGCLQFRFAMEQLFNGRTAWGTGQ